MILTFILVLFHASSFSQDAHNAKLKSSFGVDMGVKKFFPRLDEVGIYDKLESCCDTLGGQIDGYSFQTAIVYEFVSRNDIYFPVAVKPFYSVVENSLLTPTRIFASSDDNETINANIDVNTKYKIYGSAFSGGVGFHYDRFKFEGSANLDLALFDRTYNEILLSSDGTFLNSDNDFNTNSESYFGSAASIDFAVGYQFMMIEAKDKGKSHSFWLNIRGEYFLNAPDEFLNLGSSVSLELSYRIQTYSLFNTPINPQG